jgi:hypothetical protein
MGNFPHLSGMQFLDRFAAPSGTIRQPSIGKVVRPSPQLGRFSFSSYAQINDRMGDFPNCQSLGRRDTFWAA